MRGRGVTARWGNTRQRQFESREEGQISSIAAVGIGKDARADSRQWIETPAFDLFFFILSPLVGLALLLITPHRGMLLAIAVATLIGGPHYLSTYTFFLWDDTAAYHRQRWTAHFIVPLLIVAAVALMARHRIAMLIPVLVYFWNTWHVARQSCGILSIYRHRAGIIDPAQKFLNNGAIIGSNFSLALWHIDWYPDLHRFLLRFSSVLPNLLWMASTAVAVTMLGRLGFSFWKRYRAGQGPGTAELGFLGTSLLIFHPYLWVRDANLATLGMLTGHFIQYLAIVWLLSRRKFAPGAGSLGQRSLSFLSRHLPMLLPLLLLAGFMFLVLQLSLPTIAITLVLLHFYLDGLFWAMKQPQVRKAMAPYLMAGSTPLPQPH